MELPCQHWAHLKLSLCPLNTIWKALLCWLKIVEKCTRTQKGGVSKQVVKGGLGISLTPLCKHAEGIRAVGWAEGKQVKPIAALVRIFWAGHLWVHGWSTSQRRGGGGENQEDCAPWAAPPPPAPPWGSKRNTHWNEGCNRIAWDVGWEPTGRGGIPFTLG